MNFVDIIKQSLPEIFGSAVGVLLSLVLIEIVLPYFTNKRKKIRERLDIFYSIAYSFVKIREGFSVTIEGQTHNKENCGLFHSFEGEGLNGQGALLNESTFHQLCSTSMHLMSSELQDAYIDYLKIRTATSSQYANNALSCHDRGMINARKRLEEIIIKDYKKLSGEK